jgi:hypothetical protein
MTAYYPYSSYQMGMAVKMSCTFTVSSTNTDPTTVTLEITDPNGTQTDYTYAGGTVDKDATGIYSKTITPNLAGYWKYRFVGTGACIAANSFKFVMVST